MNKFNVTSISIRDEWTLRWAAVDLKFLSLFLIDKEIVWTYIVIKNVS